MGSIYYRPGDYSYRDSGWVARHGGRGAYVCGNHGFNLDQTRASYEEKLIARKERIRQLRQSRKQITTMAKVKDGNEIICGYLRSKNIDFKTNRFLKINNKTVSVDFLLEDKNIIIKYWNPVEILALEQQAQYKRNYYKRYLETWSDYCGKYQRAGGKIYQIISADTEEILAELTLCHELNDG